MCTFGAASVGSVEYACGKVCVFGSASVGGVIYGHLRELQRLSDASECREWQDPPTTGVGDAMQGCSCVNRTDLASPLPRPVGRELQVENCRTLF